MKEEQNMYYTVYQKPSVLYVFRNYLGTIMLKRARKNQVLSDQKTKKCEIYKGEKIKEYDRNIDKNKK